MASSDYRISQIMPPDGWWAVYLKGYKEGNTRAHVADSSITLLSGEVFPANRLVGWGLTFEDEEGPFVIGLIHSDGGIHVSTGHDFYIHESEIKKDLDSKPS